MKTLRVFGRSASSFAISIFDGRLIPDRSLSAVRDDGARRSSIEVMQHVGL
jgi:hypothetical protein